MGCFGSKENRYQAYTLSSDGESHEEKAHGAPEGKPKKELPVQAVTASSHISNLPIPKLDPKDFQVVDCKNEVKVKPPGTINGQSFKIDKCENCDIYILDYCAQVTIDDSKGCRIFIGPTDGAVFIRNCSGCSLAVVCRQLRTRDCTDCRVSLYCRTKPIVESSARMGFSCFDMPYNGLADHMREAKLGTFHNFWSDIFDFTPKDANWHLLPPASTAASLLEPLPQEVSGHFSASESDKSPVIKSLGGHPQSPGADTFVFVAFGKGKHEQALQVARSASEQGWLLRTNEVKLSAAAAATLAADAGWAKGVGKELTTTQGTVGCVGLELALPQEAAEKLRAQVKELGGHSTDSQAAAKGFRFQGVDG